MEDLAKIAEQLGEESETFKNLAAGAKATNNEVRLPASTVEGLARRFAQLAESLRTISKTKQLGTQEHS
ncbi:MAG TPA: hypothetical protein VH088_18965 [Terriglobales bacterium]|jgi:hypothetical protein|nr:hypothetical protein [Terriglobales bacterium]